MSIIMTVLLEYIDQLILSITVRGKNLEGENFGEFGEWCTIRQIFPHQYSYKYSEITEDLPADSPKFSSPFASSVMICQNFIPPKFSRVWYAGIVIMTSFNACPQT